MGETIVFIFEGDKTENKIFQSMKNCFQRISENKLIVATFNTDIYQLHAELTSGDDNEYIDIVEMLRTHDSAKEDLKYVGRRDVSEVYLFFDYDGYAHKANDQTLQELLDYFDQETEMGRLFISYPMVESIKHLNDSSFQDVCVAAKENIKYKKLVAETGARELQNLEKLKHTHWAVIIDQHSRKMSYLLMSEFILPEKYVSQLDIFNKQLEKHIIPKKEVAVLSAFGIFIVDYYGAVKLKEIIDKLSER